jgi:hypothetical protein
MALMTSADIICVSEGKMSNIFTTNNCGSAIGAASGGPMGPDDGDMVLNGSSDLSSCICGDASDSYLERVWVEAYSGAQYHYKIHAFGAGPSGLGNRLHLMFTMAGGEQVTLTLASTTPEDHDVKCITTGIVQMTWKAD